MSFNVKERRRVAIDCSQGGLTEQKHKDSCDIHVILRKAEKTGVIEHVNAYGGTYGDMPDSTDYLQHMLAIKKAEEMFMSVPARIRKKFENDPGQYIDFMQDPSNYDEIVSLGLDASHLPQPTRSEPELPVE